MPSKTRVPLDDLKLGTMCSQPIFGEDGVLLIGGNTRITEQVLKGLRDRDILVVEIDPRDLQNKAANKRKKKPERRNHDQWRSTIPLKSMLVDQFEKGFSRDFATQLQVQFQHSKQPFGILEHRIQSQNLSSVISIKDLTLKYAREMVQDHDQTVGVIGKLDDDHPWAVQSTRLAVTAMAIAIDRDFDGPQSLEIGLAGMLHSAGLIAMDAIYRGPVSQFTPDQLWDFTKHPLLTSRIIQEAVEVPYNITIAVQQIYEQYDGSGFPRCLSGRRIHPYARILNVAEAYIRLTTATPDRPAVVPHDAIGFLLVQAAKGVFDPQAVRSLLHSQTLFPLGSFVELNDGNRYQVARRPRKGYVNPVVIDDDGKRTNLEIASLKIVRPIASKARSEVRLSRSDMTDRKWDAVTGLGANDARHDAA